MKNDSLVSVVIPTYNSERTIDVCLRSVKKQTYSNIEVIVVDSYSNDRTREIAENFNVKLITTKQKLLGARYTGVKESKGKYVLLLDADQILNSTVIVRSLRMFKNYDMLCLEEHSYKPKTWIQWLFEADRQLVHNLANIHLDPIEGVLLARFYKRGVLEKALENIPRQLLPFVVAHDHAIIYYEAYKVSQKVGIVSDAVWHIEPSSLVELWRKNYRYGKTTRELVNTGFYQDLLKKKIRFRKGALAFKNLRLGILSYLLLTLKGLAYQIGYWVK